MRAKNLLYLITIGAFLFLSVSSSFGDTDIVSKKKGAKLNIKNGVTQKKDILAFFGKPVLVQSIEGKECWFYKSGMRPKTPQKENYLIFFQFSKEGVIEEVLLVTPRTIPALGRRIWEYKMRHGQLGPRWDANIKKYGMPEKMGFSGKKVIWTCGTTEKIMEDEDIFEGLKARTVMQESRVVEFDRDGNVVKEYLSRKEVPKLAVKVTEGLPEDRKEMLRDIGEEILSGPQAGLIIFEDEGADPAK
jgi:hypothetical protein